MALFKNDQDLKDKLKATQAEVQDHESLISKREAEIVNITEQMAEVSEKLETRTAELAEATKENANLTADLEEAKAQLIESTNAQTEFESKVDKAAQAKMAELGVKEPIEQKEEDQESDLYSQYTKLKATDPAQAGAFWRANEAKIKALI